MDLRIESHACLSDKVALSRFSWPCLHTAFVSVAVLPFSCLMVALLSVASASFQRAQAGIPTESRAQAEVALYPFHFAASVSKP